jgi:predicted component of type VI protein secretion system
MSFRRSDFMAARLVPLARGAPITLDKPIMLVGRNPDCDIVLQTSTKVSRRHCCIAQVYDRYVIRDLGSMNGVRINGQRVVEGDLTPGCQVSVGDVVFSFQVDVTSSSQQSAPRPHYGRPPAAPPRDVSLEFPVAIQEEDRQPAPPGIEQVLKQRSDEIRLKDDSQQDVSLAKR